MAVAAPWALRTTNVAAIEPWEASVTCSPEDQCLDEAPPKAAEQKALFTVGNELPRGLGTVTARVPGTREVVSGVRLTSHTINVVVHAGTARTVVEEELTNDTSRVLEGRYVFPVPPGASLSRLALYVDKTLVEGEMVERDRARRIFDGIVDDTVRPRDPAILEWVRGSEVSLKVFPIPAHGSRRVLLAYDELVSEHGGSGHYVYPLSLGADKAATIGDLSLRVTLPHRNGAPVKASLEGVDAKVEEKEGATEITYRASSVSADHDWVVRYDAPKIVAPSMVMPASFRAAEGSNEPRFTAVRLTVPRAKAAPSRRDRAIVLDASHSQSKETWSVAAAIAEESLRTLPAGSRFVVLACDSACAAYPEDGLSEATEETRRSASLWLRARELGGASDLAGALVAAAQRLGASAGGQIVYLGDGSPTAGELSPATILARVKPEIGDRSLDLRLIGSGRSVDDVVFRALSQGLAAPYERFTDGRPSPERAAQIVADLDAPVLRRATLTVPPDLIDVYPRELPGLRAGQDIIITAKQRSGGERADVKLTGDLEGQAISVVEGALEGASADPRSVQARLWAEAKMADLASSSDPKAHEAIIALSKRHHVLSRQTALLVLENDQMFAAFGIPRTQGKDSSAAMFGNPASLGSIGVIGRGGDGAPPKAPWGDSASPGGLGLNGVGEGASGNLWGQGFGSGFGAGHAPAVKGPVGNASIGGPSIGGASVSGGSLPSGVVTRIIRQQFGRLRRCYHQALMSDPTLRGSVRVTVRIGPGGEVTSVTAQSATLPAPVTSCVQATFRSLQFPAPDGGGATAVIPVTFTPDGASPVQARPRWVQQGPSAQHLDGDDGWMSAGGAEIDKLREALARDPESRKSYDALVQKLLARGRFAEALDVAQRFVERDPDSQRALDLVAAAAAANGEGPRACVAVDAMLEGSPRSITLHQRAARAFEAAGDEARACAHLRSIAELDPASDAAKVDVMRCRARLGERDRVLAEIASIEKPSAMMTTFGKSAREGSVKPRDPVGNAGDVEVKVTCEDEPSKCPVVVLVNGAGDVRSPWTPGASRSGRDLASFSGVSGGLYRAVIAGGSKGARGSVEVRAFGAVRRFAIPTDGRRTLAMTRIMVPAASFGGAF